MSHPFGDRLSQYLHRKHGLSQAKLAEGILQDPSIIGKMCKGQRLTGPQARARVLAIIGWLARQATVKSAAEANALLAAAGMAPLRKHEPSEGTLLAQLHHAPSATASLASTPAASAVTTPPRKPNSLVPLPHFVGRRQEWRSLRAAWAVAERGGPHCVLI